MRRRSRASTSAAWSIPAFAAARRSRAPRTGRRDPDGAPLYPGTCRALSPAEARDRLARGDKAAFRLDMRRALDAAPAGSSLDRIWRGRRSLAASGRAGGLGRRCPQRARSGGELSSGGGGRRRAAGRDRRRARARPPCLDRGPPAAAGAARPCRAALSAPPARSRPDAERNCRKAVNPCRWPNCAEQAWARAKFARRWGSARAPPAGLRSSSVEARRSRRRARAPASPPTSPRRRGLRP